MNQAAMEYPIAVRINTYDYGGRARAAGGLEQFQQAASTAAYVCLRYRAAATGPQQST